MTRAIFSALLAGVLLLTPARAADDPVVRLTGVDGDVSIFSAGSDKARAAKEGEVIERGDAVAAGEKSAAVLSWSNGSMVRVYPGAKIVVEGVTFDLEKKLEKTYLTLERGRLFVKAQTPEHLFCEFQIRAAERAYLSQGAEFAISEISGKVTVWTVLGRVITDVNLRRYRIDDKQQIGVWRADEKDTAVISAVSDQTQQSLMKVSKDLGGSLLMEEEGKPGGPLTVRIGGVPARRGTAPYAVRFKALISGGSGKIKKIEWDFGDGTTVATKMAEHRFTQGVYVVILRVEDENGQKASAQINISAEEDCNC